MREPSAVTADFDRIARLSADCPDQRTYCHDYLFRHVPDDCRLALDVGCGTGDFTRRLATRARRVIGIDFSDEMIRVARARSASHPNIEYVAGDTMQWDWGELRFDCVASLATLHHLPVDEALARMKGALTQGGTLLVQDLRPSRGPVDRLLDFAAALRQLGRLRKCDDTARELRRAWAEHGRNDTYLTMSQVSAVCARHLAGATVKRHLMWRYSIIWRAGAFGAG